MVIGNAFDNAPSVPITPRRHRYRTVADIRAA
jgi:hypothetical protein